MVGDQREKRVLEQVVEVHYKTCEPVGSAALSRTRVLPYSAATIRGIMGLLEEQGLLSQPHTSAGRVPTDLGYRSYVDDITLHFTPITMWNHHDIDIHLKHGDDPISALETLAQLLHQRTRLVSFYMPFHHSAWRIRHILLQKIAESRVLIVMIAQGGQVLKQVLDSGEKRYTTALLERMSAYLNRNFSGRSLVDIGRELTRTLGGSDAESDVLLNACARLVFDLERELRQQDELKFLGFKGIFNAPEFQDVHAIRRLYGLIEDKDKLQTIVAKNAANPDDSIVVFIGSELRDPDLADLSVFMTRIRSRHRWLGCVGVLGPKRMPYLTSYQLLSYAKFKYSGETYFDQIGSPRVRLL